MAKYRRLSRTVALQTLTALLLRAEDSPEAAERSFTYIKEEFTPELREKDDFARTLVKGVLDGREMLDGKIFEYAPEWPIDKLSSVERTILEIGAFELMNFPDTPVAVIINEWVDLAKEFGDITAGKFVNGVLSSIAHEVRKKEAGAPHHTPSPHDSYKTHHTARLGSQK